MLRIRCRPVRNWTPSSNVAARSRHRGHLFKLGGGARQPIIEEMPEPCLDGRVMDQIAGKVLGSVLGALERKAVGTRDRPAMHHEAGHFGMELHAESRSSPAIGLILEWLA